MAWDKKEDNKNPYNDKLVKTANDSAELIRIMAQQKLQSIKDGAKLIASKSNDPRMTRILDKIDALRIK